MKAISMNILSTLKLSNIKLSTKKDIVLYYSSYVIIAIMAIAALFLLNSCEDQPDMDYAPINFVDASLYVGEPIMEIKLLRSQPVSEIYSIERVSSAMHRLS